MDALLANMRDADRLDEAVIGEILTQLPDDATGDLSDLERMGQAGTITITVTQIEDLRLPLQPAEGCRVDDAGIVHIAFVAGLLGLGCPVLLPRIPLRRRATSAALTGRSGWRLFEKRALNASAVDRPTGPRVALLGKGLD